ncbi:VirB4 family type IV secretion system protein [Polycladidibacter hongkongensis]|uniref:VirB4 family type IV secretion system protein n=1 Tax=Polycladidibacter hongkongensis TaxID=1647556 RepID=UPI0008345E7B|nr:VirB4 family type IV secretion system protein [Pseudovibrio hongkongensis]
MFVSTGLTFAAAGLGAAMAFKKSRSWVLGDVDHDWLAHELEFDEFAEDGKTVLLKDGSAMRVLTLKGLPYETMPFEQETSQSQRRANWLHQNVTDGVNLRLFGVKRQRDASFAAAWPAPSLEVIGKAEQELYSKAYGIEWFLVFSSKKPKALEKACRSALQALSEYKVRDVLAAKGSSEPCQLTRFINYLVCGDLREDLPRISRAVSASIPACDLRFDKSGEIHTATPDERLGKVIGVRLWSTVASGHIIAQILALHGELEVFQYARPLNNERAVAIYTRQIMEQENNFFGNDSVLEELHSLKDDLVNRKNTYYETQFQITIRARSQEEMSELIDAVAEILSKNRIVYSVETGGAAVSWFNRMPGREKALRPLRLYDVNLATLWPFQYSPEGLYSSPFGDRPVRLFKTPTAQNYAFQFHVSDKPQSAGNYLVFAPTGAGKSTLIMHLLGGLSKFAGVRNYIFDSKEGARFMIEAMGGTYQGYEDLALNPLDTDLEDKAASLRAMAVLKAMLGNAYSESMDDDLKVALDMASVLTPPERTLSNIYDAAFPARSEIKTALARWVTTAKGNAGQFAHVFNEPRDRIRGFLEQSHLVGINMNEALEDSSLGPALVAHIATAISEAAKANRGGFSIFVDEAANLLQNAGFRSVVLQMFREYRKLNGLVGLAFQDPEALYSFPDAQGMIKNAQTLIFLPNSQASTESLEPFNLTGDQIAFIKGERQLGKGRHVLVVKRDLSSGFDESAIIDVDLSGLGADALRFYRAGTTANADLQAIKQKWGAEWLAHI